MSAPILVVEDNDDDLVLLRRALKAAAITAPIAVVGDGRTALDYLSGSGDYGDRQKHPLPRVVLLDLKLPRMSGLDVLKWLRAEPGLRRLPVVVLTSSDEDRDVRAAYDLGANSYVVKPASVSDLETVAATLRAYWLELNVHPPLDA
jgi:CheY-like chemotaxis protein